MGTVPKNQGGERFKHTTRPYKVEDVVKLQGSRGSFDGWEGRFSNLMRASFGINKDETHEKSSNVRSYSHTFRVKLRMVFSMGFAS